MRLLIINPGSTSTKIAIITYAVDMARKLGIEKPKVAGDADILIFPNIEAGNIFFKTCTYLAGGEVAAIVAGANCPAILTSRSDSEDSKFFSIALGALMA